MKKSMLFVVIILIFFSAAASHGSVVLDILNPTQYVRGTGSPDAKVLKFSSDLGGAAIINITNGSLTGSSIEKVSSCVIKLNSQTVFGPSDFNQKVTSLEKQILLKKGNNTIDVELRGKPGGQIVIKIQQPVSNVRAVPQTVILGDPGSKLQMKVLGTLLNGAEVDLTSSTFGTVFSSQDASIATVTNSGLVAAVAIGETTVRVSNRDFLASVPVTVKGTPPTLSNVQLSRTLLPPPCEYEQFILSMMFSYSDANADAQRVSFTLTGPSGAILTISDELRPGQTAGTGSLTFVINSSYVAGQYLIGINILDAMGNSSGTQTASFTIDSSAERFLEITKIEPTRGKPGDTVVITGRGFEPDSQANSISFAKGYQKSAILSATETQLQVIVPEGATTGTIGLVTSVGRTDSLQAFAINPTISLTPASARLVAGSSADFACTPSGTDTYKITWSINGQSAPDPFLGAIDNLGHFTAPSSFPPTNPLSLRCASFDVPTVYAEASIEIIAPAPIPGQSIIRASTGGKMVSQQGEVTVDIPPGALGSDTLISIGVINPDIIPSPTENSYNLAAVQLEPSGLLFSKPVTVVFSLRSFEEPGAVIPVYLLDGNGAPMNAGKTATVDETGFKATAAFDHFSEWLLARPMAPGEIQQKQYFQSQASNIVQQFSKFIIGHELPFYEGLSVPVRISQDPTIYVNEIGRGIGPFLAKGFSIEGVIPSTGTQLGIGPIVQPSPDGWELGTVLSIPPNVKGCHEGEMITANLKIGFEKLGLPQSITLPFPVECLDKLNFGGSGLESLPQGAEVTRHSDGTVDVNIHTLHTYRVSEMNIGPKGRLIVNYTETYAQPAVIEVTGNAVVKGEILSVGQNGGPGGDAYDYYDWCSDWHLVCHYVYGGDGGEGGFPHGGEGGKAGPNNYLESPGGENGHCFFCNNQYTHGDGIGGRGGERWVAGSFFGFMTNALSFALDLAEIAGSLGTAGTQYIAAVQDGYGLVSEGWKVWSNWKNELSSAGWGGGAPSQGTTEGLSRPISSFLFPLGGAGGGGAGKMKIGTGGDKGGGGGGGGGGGAPSLQIVTPGYVYIDSGSIDGRGGNGGRGGMGAGGWQEQAAPGGGGGGGNGAQIKIIAKGIYNNGTINLKGGGGGASGTMEGDSRPHGNTFMEQCAWPNRDCGIYLAGKDLKCPEGTHCHLATTEFTVEDVFCVPDPTAEYLIANGFGATGQNGILRVDGDFGGSLPQDSKFYQGSHLLGPLFQVASNAVFCEQVFIGGQGTSTECFNLQRGLNSIKLNAGFHQWQTHYVLYYPDFKDSDGDGLSDGIERALGTFTWNPDSDGDGIGDGSEILAYNTDPRKPDTDSDGYSDGYEIAHGSDPKNLNSYPTYTISVAKAGAGSGVVTSSPPGLNCGSFCQKTYADGLKITLEAVPSSGSYFAGWSADGCPGTHHLCTITLSASMAISARFETPTGSMTTSREGHTATLLPNGEVLIAGGVGDNPSNSPLFSAELYDPLTGTFRVTGSMKTARNYHTATLLPNGKVLVAGGDPSADPWRSTAELYDPATENFIPAGNEYMEGYHPGGFTSTLLIRGMVLIAGGFGDQPDDYPTPVEMYSPDVDLFGPAGEYAVLEELRSNHTATLLPNGKILFAGGIGSRERALSSAELYDITEVDTFSYTGSMATARANHTATLLPDGRVLITGGDDSTDILSSAELYDPSTESFIATESMTTERESHTAILLPNGKVLVAGGWGFNGTHSRAELYDPATGTFDETGSMITARGQPTATLLPDGRVLIAGGFGPDGALSSAEIYDPVSGEFSLID